MCSTKGNILDRGILEYVQPSRVLTFLAGLCVLTNQLLLGFNLDRALATSAVGSARTVGLAYCLPTSRFDSGGDDAGGGLQRRMEQVRSITDANVNNC